MSRGREYRRWKSFSKYVSRIKKRLHWMQVQYGEATYVSSSGKEWVRKLWRHPKDWKEADSNSSTAAKSLKKTPTPYKRWWDRLEARKVIKDLRSESKRIINDELNNKT